MLVTFENKAENLVAGWCWGHLRLTSLWHYGVDHPVHLLILISTISV